MGVYRDNGKNMEATIQGLGFSFLVLVSCSSFRLLEIAASGHAKGAQRIVKNVTLRFCQG